MSENKPQTESIEVIADRLQTPKWQLDGLLLRKGWAFGHPITEAQFKKELKAWLTGPTVPAQKGEK
ncbi:hypothetical protein [Deinococcus cellulosilyticus]|uniref:Uncharacterized protein n=1 Tax=Deinococcus cellulosilyticus (strain DSM 18568 / NBRC 106333 / KACC 11606 / 5516J-15) TaxID=1223518 RepID=A0A511MX33_DEIC1|nr:hypothetical protein [Deinococcus cellulosilyticus]GEM44828.1 hypothetical protein DC3_04630 [Deinococcus cellulosilyticus NBRC 106333 = KACC 11606]